MNEVRLSHNAEYIDQQGAVSLDVKSLFEEQRRRSTGGMWNPASIKPVFEAIYYEVRWLDSGREMSAIKALTFDSSGRPGKDGLVDVVMTSDKDPHVEHTQYRLFESILPEKERLTISQPDPNDPLAPWITRFGVVGSNKYRETKEARQLAEEFAKRREAAFDMDKDLKLSGMPAFEGVSEKPVVSFWHQEEIYPGDKDVKKPSVILDKEHELRIKALEEEKKKKEIIEASEKAKAEAERKEQLAKLRSALGTRREKIEIAEREEAARSAYADQIERLGQEFEAGLSANEEEEFERARMAIAQEAKKVKPDPKGAGKALEMSSRKSKRLKQARSQMVKNDKARLAVTKAALREMGPIFEDSQIEIWKNLADDLDAANNALERYPFITQEELAEQYRKRIEDAVYEGEERQRWLNEFNTVGETKEEVIVFDGLKDHKAEHTSTNGNGHKEAKNKDELVLPEGTRLLKMKNGQQRLQRIKDGKFVGKDGKTKKEREPSEGRVIFAPKNGAKVEFPPRTKDQLEETDQIHVAVGVRITKTSHVSS